MPSLKVNPLTGQLDVVTSDSEIVTAVQGEGYQTEAQVDAKLASKADASDISNVDNTSDVDKPVSTAQQAALDLKGDASDISNVDNTSDVDKPVSTAQQAALDLKADFTSISNIDNTSDADKPVSTAQQAALDLKADVTTRTEVSADYTVLPTDTVIRVTPPTGGVVITLPNASLFPGRIIEISTSGVGTLNPTQGKVEINDGAVRANIFTANESVRLQSTGGFWSVLSRYIPSNWNSYLSLITSWATSTAYTARYRRVGNSVEFEVNFNSTGPHSGLFEITAPFTASADQLNDDKKPIGTAIALDPGNAFFNGIVAMNTLGIIQAVTDGNGNYWSATNPFTWTGGDEFQIRFSYQVDGWES